ncbi:MAG: threonine dehydratase [Pseudohaliea sp.]
MTADTLFTFEELETAAQTVRRTVPPTPQYRWPLLGERYGCEVWVKHENHTPTGAFKVRGGLTYLEELAAGGLPAGLVTATRGNHGQSIPFAAARYGVPVTVVVPEGNSADKNRAMRGWGAEVITHGGDFDEARAFAAALARERGLALVPSFHPALVRGVASYALELFTAVAGLDTVYVPIGMGSGICAVITVRDLLGLDTEVVGVTAAGAPAYAESFRAGEPRPQAQARTFADGVACRDPDGRALDIILAGAARVLSVTDAEIAEAMRVLFTDTHNVAEGAGAAALAGLAQEQARQQGRRVAAILCGGNVDTSVFAAVLQGASGGPGSPA